MPACQGLPCDIKGLFPKENLEFADSISIDEAQVLKDVFNEHDCFEKIGEMIDAVAKKDAKLAGRMKHVLDKNCTRLEGLSPAGVDYSKRIIHFITHLQCMMTLGKDCCTKKAEELHNEFKSLSAADQAALQKNNPDVQF